MKKFLSYSLTLYCNQNYQRKLKRYSLKITRNKSKSRWNYLGTMKNLHCFYEYSNNIHNILDFLR